MPDSKIWFYVKDDERVGPITEEEVNSLVIQGSVKPQTLVWSEGMENWEEAGAHFSFKSKAFPPEVPSRESAVGFNEKSPEKNQMAASDDGLYAGAPSRGFLEAVRVCLNKYATFSGRASRSEYWFFLLFTSIAAWTALFADSLLVSATRGGSYLYLIVTLAFIIPSAAAAFRRLHDTNRSGWWLGISAIWLIASVGLIVIGLEMHVESLVVLAGLSYIGLLIYTVVIFVFTVQKGDLGPNRFG